MMPLRNYTSSMPVTKILSKLQVLLAKHGAKRVAWDYDIENRECGVSFSLEHNGEMLVFKLPICVAEVALTLEREHGEKRWEQAERTAWKNLHDLVDVQLSMLQYGQVKAAQIYLPFLVVDSDGTTAFERFEQSQVLLPSGEEGDD